MSQRFFELDEAPRMLSNIQGGEANVGDLDSSIIAMRLKHD